MTHPTATLHSLPPSALTEPDIAALHVLSNQIRAETLPGEPLRSLDNYRMMVTNIPPIVTVNLWLARIESSRDLVGMADTQFMPSQETNRHLVQADLYVLPAYRRQGIGRQLLAEITRYTREQGRTLVMGGTDSMAPGGEALMLRLGAEMGMRAETNQLLISEVDHALMRQWIAAGEALPDYELVCWEDVTPEEEMQPYLRVKTVMNTAPTDSLDVGDMEWTPEIVRQLEATNLARGVKKWMLLARHKPSGAFAGFTEAQFSADRPDIMSQQDTAVDPAHRGHGLGRWLKAAMIEKVTAEMPLVDKVRTGNAGSNAPMLAINHQMGFRLFKENKFWQITVADLETYLSTP